MSEHTCGAGCSHKSPASESSTGKVSIQNGKGSGPRNMSKTFLNNYEGIRWESAGKKRKEGTKFVKVY